MLLNQKIPLAFYVRTIQREMLLVFLFANLVVLAKHFFQLRYLAVPLTIPTLLGTCISLLLAFRTSQSYERWWEARILWGAIVNDSRTFIRQLQMFLPDLPDQATLLHSFVQRQCAWCFVLADSLRGLDQSPHLVEFFEADQVPLLLTQDNLPNRLLLDHGLALRELYRNHQLTDYQLAQLSTTLDNLTASMGGCERIKNTVFPRTYTFNIQVLIYLFTAILPFCFEADLYFLDVPLVTLIASTFLLIEKSAVQLQEPFENKPTDTPMTAIARTIELNLKTMSSYRPLPQKTSIPGYYSL